MERIAIAMQDGGTGAGARHEAAARAARPFVLPPNLYKWAPGRGDFLSAIPGNLVRNDFWW